jgi:hypothetical protein
VPSHRTRPTGDLSGHLDQRYVTEQRGLVGITR